VVGLTLLLLAWRVRSATVRRSSQGLIVLAFALHTVGLAFTFVLAGRPSAITFAGWAAALAALGVALRLRGAGFAVAAAAGSVGLVTAYALAPGGASVLARSASDIGLATAVVATAVALGAASVAARLAPWHTGVGRTASAGAQQHSRQTLVAR
jgi:hypothetical protein